LDKIKQVIVLRKDLGMSFGKAVAQACHVALNSYKVSDASHIEKWEAEGVTKVVLETYSEASLKKLHAKAAKLGLPCDLILDEGRTEFSGEHHYTALGIGPCPAELINKITGHLALYSYESKIPAKFRLLSKLKSFFSK
jgi:PTH2 family peptidyl-tRNA hydrolase